MLLCMSRAVRPDYGLAQNNLVYIYTSLMQVATVMIQLVKLHQQGCWMLDFCDKRTLFIHWMRIIVVV